MDQEIDSRELGKLRSEEKKLVDDIKAEIGKVDTECSVVYLPNLPPKKKAAFILVTMEPSLGNWAKSEDEAETLLHNGFKNFMNLSQNVIHTDEDAG